jgi:phosphoribosylaminoimidazole-succinocarboxamide synthase
LKSKKNIVYEETGKIIYYEEEEDCFLIDYNDEVELNSKEKVKIKNIGAKHTAANSFFLDFLNAYNISTGYKKVVENSILINKHYRFPFYIKILNILDKRSAKIFNKLDGEILQIPLLTFHFGNQNDNLISENHLISLEQCLLEDIKIMKRLCSKVNAVMKSYFERRNVILAELNCFFGKEEERIFVVDDFTSLSIKILQNNNSEININPYKIKTAEEIKNYADIIHNLVSN